jgi:hypothetical protein
MKKTALSRITSLALAIPLLLPLGAAPVVAQENCWDNSAIQSALSSGQIQPVASVLAREGIPGSTQVLTVKVCEQGGAPVYVIAVLEESGQARNLTLGAQ